MQHGLMGKTVEEITEKLISVSVLFHSNFGKGNTCISRKLDFYMRKQIFFFNRETFFVFISKLRGNCASKGTMFVPREHSVGLPFEEMLAQQDWKHLTECTEHVQT